MGNLNERFDELATYLQDPSARGKLAMLVYSPPIERSVVNQLPEFVRRLEHSGLNVATVDINRAVSAAIQERLNDVLEMWKTRRKDVLRAIAERSAAIVLSETRKHGKSDAIIWTRVGGAYPFLGIASTMEDLIGKLQATLVVFYPGSLEEKTRLRLLDERDGYQYRAQFLRTVDE